MPKPFLLVDRDGTLIVEKHYLSDPDGVEIIAGIPQALKRFQDEGWGIAVVTNQAGIGRGYYGIPEMESVNDRVRSLLSEHGVAIDGFYACPHAPDEECECRKPKPGLVKRAANELRFDPLNAVVVGDKACDINLGLGVGAFAVLVRTGYGKEEEAKPDLHPDLVIDSLADLKPADITLHPAKRTSGNLTNEEQTLMGNQWNDYAVEHLTESIAVKQRVIESCVGPLVESAAAISEAIRNGNKILICGNGGSAADSQHIAAEFISTLSMDYQRPSIPAIALTTDSSILTAIANDFGFDGVFERQVEGLGLPGDILIGMSTSGNSEVVLRAVRKAKALGMKTIGMSGRDGGKLAQLVDHAIVIPSPTTQHIQESHLALYHILVAIVERTLYPK